MCVELLASDSHTSYSVVNGPCQIPTRRQEHMKQMS